MKALLIFLLTLPALALPDRLQKDVVYVEEFAPSGITLKVAKPGWVFATSKGGRKHGTLAVDQMVELTHFTDRAYFVRGKKENGQGVSGWVTPAAFTSEEPDFVKKLRDVHERQLLVRELIKEKKIALGMTPEEVEQVLGEPTKTALKRNAEGETKTWEFIEYESVKHYRTLRDSYTGALYRQYSHTTNEVKNKTVVTFTDGSVSELEISEDKGPDRPRIVTRPIFFCW